jgi:uncharacterized protein (TIGR02145 family)
VDKNKLLPSKIILVLIVLLSFGTVLGVTAYSISFKKSPQIATSIICPPTVTDIDNNTHKTVQIGSQCWMKENLKVTKNPEGKQIKRYCPNYDDKLCNTEGGIYSWDTAMNNSTQEGAQGICPNGWHVPKDSEWYTLENFLKDDGQSCDSTRGGRYGEFECEHAGAKLKQGGSSGFDAILIGYRVYTGHGDQGEVYFGRDEYTFFWSSTEAERNAQFGGIDSAWSRELESMQSPDAISRFPSDMANGLSIRCLKD